MNAKLVDSKTLKNITESDRRKILVAYLQEQIAKLLGIKPSEVEEQQPLRYLGIDSLIAIKLRNRLRTDLSVDISAVKFMADASLTDLVVVVSQLLNEFQGETLASDVRQKDNYSTPKSYPLTYGQQGLWFLYKLAPQSAAYNIAFTARIRSDLNISALQRAFEKLIDRHPTLRTTFGQQDGEPFQEVNRDPEVCFEIVDASTWDEEELMGRALAAYKHPFDLERGPLLRVNLFASSPQDHLFLLTIHHIVVDGFSCGILLDELRLLYESENTGKTISLDPIKWQYRDFVEWQEKMLKSPLGDSQRTYWQKQFAGELPVLNLPTDRPRPPSQSHEGASYSFEISKEITEQLRKLGKAEGVTLYVTLLSVFQVLLYHYTGQEDIIVGSPTEGRSQSKFTRTVGFFVNMLAIRVNLGGNPKFSELLSQVRQTVLDALTHQDYPSPLLIEGLHLNRDRSLLGLFRVSFNLLPLREMVPEYELSVSPKTTAKEDWGGLYLEPFVIPQQEGQNDIVFDVIDRQESLLGIFKYNTDLFDSTTINRMAEHFQNLLEGVVADREQPICSLPLLQEEERDRLLLEWNDTQVEYPKDRCIHQLFEAQVELTPNVIAVVFKDRQLTYRELNDRANKLARYLQKLGVSSEVLVGICVDRSLETIVGLLGILKAGGAYLALDPNYPQKRLNFMLSDARVSVLLTQEKLAANFLVEDITVVCLDRDWEIINQECESNLVNSVTPENLAYVVYTSGSTGTSKGVAITHQSLVNAYQSWEKVYQLRSLTSHLQMASFSFDVFSGDTIRALCSGAKLVLCPREWLLEPEKLYKLMLQEKIDIGEFVPAVLRNLVQYLEKTKQDLHFMRLLIVGSDSLYVKEYEEFKHFCGSNTRLINSYGVSEATIDSTYFETTKVNLSVDGLVPIGRPFANTQTYILDSYLQPVPIGVVGELHIGGIGLGRGYLNRPDLTEQKFIPNPFDKSKLLYKTGDLARYLSDGNIEFLGRIDNQVKIRGYRIELGEIEAAIGTHPEIKEVVAIALEDRADNKYLVAYIVARSRFERGATRSESLSIREVRNFLKQKLPDYMVPSFFVMLEALPLTPNGKIDRRALPAPDIEENRQVEFVAPRSDTEEAIASIFTSVLKLKRVGIHDNFFELGGHSLLATQVISALQLIAKTNQNLDTNISLNLFLQYPTVAELADRIAQNTKASATSKYLVPIQEEGTNPPLFCIHPAGGQVMVYRHLAASLGGDRPVLGLQSGALNASEQEHESIDRMAVEYTQEIRQYQPHGPYYLMGWSMGGVIAVSVAKELEKQGQKVALVGVVDSYLISENGATFERDPFMELALLFGGTFVDAFTSLDAIEQQKLRNELRDLSSRQRLQKIMIWGQERNLLSTEISIALLEKQLILTEIHERLIKVHHSPKIKAPIYSWCALDKLEAELSSTDWSQYTTGASYEKILDGNHFSIVRPPHIKTLARELEREISKINNDEISTLADLSSVQARKFPDSRALVFEDKALTYLQLDRQSNQVANALLALKIQPGSRVAILAKDSPKSYEILFACAKIKAVLVPINWRLAASEVSYILNDAEVELLFVDSEFHNLVKSIERELAGIKTFITLEKTAENWLNYTHWCQQYRDVSPEITLEANDVAVQLYTSGTTGKPKGVQLGHYSFFAVAKEWTRQGQNWMNWRQTDKSLLVVPFFHIGGLWWAIRGFVAGAENILLSAFNPREVLEVIGKYSITKAGMVPAMIQVLLCEPQCQETDFSSLEYVLYGGSPIAESLLREAMKTFSCNFVQIYGMTETGNCAVCLPEEAHTSSNTNLLKSVGKPFPGVSVVIVDSQGKELPPSQIGEIRIKSPANTISYWNLPEATAKTLVDGWIHTGDAGYFDEEGYIYICDRIKDMICCAGENIYPAEIENIIYEHPAVSEVAVIGVPDEYFGETVKAIVVLKDWLESTALDIVNFVRGKIADFKLPRSVEFTDSLPRTPSGKVQKGKLREKYWQGYQRKVN